MEEKPETKAEEGARLMRETVERLKGLKPGTLAPDPPKSDLPKT